MPNCFQLTKKGEQSPTALAKIDEELCKLLNKEVHPTQYICGWFDTIGWWIAVRGHHLGTPEIWEDYKEWFEGDDNAKYIEAGQLPPKQAIKNMLDYLEENYSSNAWAEIGKR